MNSALSTEATRLLQRHSLQNWESTDRMFGRLLLIEWIAVIAIAIWSSPFTWSGPERELHPHVWIAVVLGGIVVLPPLWLLILRKSSEPRYR